MDLIEVVWIREDAKVDERVLEADAAALAVDEKGFYNLYAAVAVEHHACGSVNLITTSDMDDPRCLNCLLPNLYAELDRQETELGKFWCSHHLGCACLV